MRSPLPALAALLVLAGCALPERDNPRDSGRAPAAVLRIGDATGPNGECAISAQQPPEVLTASRGRCLVLDASATTDPQEDAITFRFRLVSPREEEVPGTDPVVRIPDTILRDPALVGVPLVFEVRASDGVFHSKDLATVTLTNSPPTVDVGSPRSLPLGGYPWLWTSGATSFDVELAVLETLDADRDAVQLCWTLPAGTEDCSEPNPRIQIPWDEPTAVRAKVRAFDGVAYSPPRSVVVFVRSPNVWTHATDPLESDDPIERLDSRRRVSAVLGTSALVDMASDAGESVVVASQGPSYSVRLSQLDGSGDTELAFAIEPGDAKALGASAERVWLLHSCTSFYSECPNYDPMQSPDTSILTATTWALPDLSARASFDASDVPFDLADRDLVLSVDEQGAAWISLQLNDELRYLTATGDGDTLFATPGYVFSDHQARPETNEVWAIEVPEGGQTASTQLAVFEDGVRVRTVPLGAPVGYKIAWVAADRFWTYVPGDGMRLVELPALEAGAPLAEASVLAPVLFLPSLHGGPLLFPNPLTAECYALGPGGLEIVLARQDGSYEEILVASGEGGFSAEVLFVDANGSTWFRGGGGEGFYVGDSPGLSKVARTVDVGSFEPEYDYSTGGLWLPMVIPGALAEIGEDGRVLRFVSTASIGGETPLLEDPIVFAMHPDGSAAWALMVDFATIEIRGLYRFDLLSDSLTTVPASLVIGSAELASMGDVGGLLEASAPVPGTTPFVWATRGLGGLEAVVRIEEDGSGFDVAAFNVPPDESETKMANSPRDNSLCLATVRDAGPEAVVRRLETNGSVSVLATIPLAPGEGLRGVTQSSTPEEDLCWVAIAAASVSRVLAIAPDGSIVRDGTIAGSVESMLAESRDLVWYSADEGITQRKVKGIWNGSGFDEEQMGFEWISGFVPLNGRW